MTDSKDIKTGQSLPSWAQSFKGGRDTQSNDCSCIKGTAGTGGGTGRCAEHAPGEDGVPDSNADHWKEPEEQTSLLPDFKSHLKRMTVAMSGQGWRVGRGERLQSEPKTIQETAAGSENSYTLDIVELTKGHIVLVNLEEMSICFLFLSL